jgi:hypothetical protein
MGNKSVTAVLIIILTLFSQGGYAQCDLVTSLPQNAPLRDRNRPDNVHALPGGVYLVKYDKKKCGCGMPRIAVGATGVKNGYPATVKIKLKGYGCDGKEVSGSYMATNVSPGQWDEGLANAHYFKDVRGITVLRVEVEYYDEEFKAKYSYVTDYETGKDETYIDYKPWTKIKEEDASLRTEVNGVIKQYNHEYDAVWASLSKVKDPAKHQELKSKLEKNHSSFLDLDKRAQPRFVNQLQEANKEMREIIKQMQQLENELKEVAPDIETAYKDAEEESKKKEEARQKTESSKATANNPNTKVAPQQTTSNINNINTQQQYQAQSKEYLDKANNTDQQGSIQQAYDLNMAKINALASGNKIEARQIEQQQQQATQVNINAIANTLTNAISNMAAGRQARADMGTQRSIWMSQLRLREYIYEVIHNYSRMYMDKLFSLSRPSNLSVYDPWNSGPDEWSIYPDRKNQSIEKAVNANDGIGLGMALFGKGYEGILTSFIKEGTIYNYEYDKYNEGINSPFKEKVYIDAGSCSSCSNQVYLRYHFTDNRSKKELKINDSNDVRTVLPMVCAYGSFNGEELNANYFDRYLKKFGFKPGYRPITQWLYQYKANYLCEKGLKEQDKSKLYLALGALDTAEAVSDKNDYTNPVAIPYDISLLLNPEYYYYNLFCIKVGKMYILYKLSELPNISAEEKTNINNGLLLIYYQVKNDFVPVFSDNALQAPHQIKYK